MLHAWLTIHGYIPEEEVSDNVQNINFLMS